MKNFRFSICHCVHFSFDKNSTDRKKNSFLKQSKIFSKKGKENCTNDGFANFQNELRYQCVRMRKYIAKDVPRSASAIKARRWNVQYHSTCARKENATRWWRLAKKDSRGTIFTYLAKKRILPSKFHSNIIPQQKKKKKNSRKDFF